MRKIEKEITVTLYEAFDGTEFKTDTACLNYEGSAFGMLLQQLENCILSASVLPDGRKCYCLVPKTRHDIFVIEQIYKMAGKDAPCPNVCEHLSLLTVRLNCNTVEDVDVSNLENYIKEVSDGAFAVVSAIKKSAKVKQ